MKIAIIGHKRIPGREGGIEVVVEELATRMAESNDVTVYNRFKTGVKKIKKYKGVHIVTVPTIQSKKLDAVIATFFASVHAIFCHYDVIHYHGIGPSMMLIIPHLFGVKTIVTVHGLNYKTPKWQGVGAKAMLFGERITAKYADSIITLSREQQQYFIKKYNRTSHYIPNGTVVQKLLDANIITKKWGLVKNGYVLFISRVVPGKGLENLIDAYKNVHTTLPLIIAGDSQYMDGYRNQIIDRAKEDERIRFIGFVEGATLAELYSNAYLFVFPSEAEGMPMCLLEALSYNTPCLVSDIPENLEVGRKYVRIFRTKDTADLTENLDDCINRGGRIKDNSRLYISNEYSWDKIVRNTIEVYKGVRKKTDNPNANI